MPIFLPISVLFAALDSTTELCSPPSHHYLLTDLFMLLAQNSSAHSRAAEPHLPKLDGSSQGKAVWQQGVVLFVTGRGRRSTRAFPGEGGECVAGAVRSSGRTGGSGGMRASTSLQLVSEALMETQPADFNEVWRQAQQQYSPPLTLSPVFLLQNLAKGQQLPMC